MNKKLFLCFKFPTIDELTEGEKSFALKVEEFLSNVSKPEFRQLLVEVWFLDFKHLLPSSRRFENCEAINGFLNRKFSIVIGGKG